MNEGGVATLALSQETMLGVVRAITDQKHSTGRPRPPTRRSALAWENGARWSSAARRRLRAPLGNPSINGCAIGQLRVIRILPCARAGFQGGLQLDASQLALDGLGNEASALARREAAVMAHSISTDVCAYILHMNRAASRPG